MCKCEEKVIIKFSRENERCIIPTKTNENAGYDLYADPELEIVFIEPLATAMVSTGIRSIIPEDYYAQIQERGSTGVKAMKYGAGVIDSSYRGIWNIVITNCSPKPLVIYDETKISEDDIIDSLIAKIGVLGKTIDRNKILDSLILYPMSKGIAQFVLLPVPKTKIEEVTVDEILSNKTERMEGKLGSSGK